MLINLDWQQIIGIKGIKWDFIGEISTPDCAR